MMTLALDRAPVARGRLTAGTVLGDRSARARLVIAGLGVLTVLVAALSLTVGASDLTLSVLWDKALASLSGEAGLSLRHDVILWDIRMPRMVLGLLVGAALATAGTTMQGLFRNPLADPGIVGVSGGAALFAIIAIVLGEGILQPVRDLLGIYMLPLFAFFGGVINTLLLYRIATRRGQTSVATMLLAGIAIGAMMGAVIGLLTYISDDRQLRDLTFWGMGSLGGATWGKVQAAAPFIILSLLFMPLFAQGLNALVLGDHQARHLGVNVQRLKRGAIFVIALSVGAAVAVTGGIGFVGIVVPHLLRLAIGPDHKYLLPASALLGGCLILVADMVARTVVVPAELPIGIVMSVIGGPFFLWLLLRAKGVLDL